MPHGAKLAAYRRRRNERIQAMSDFAGHENAGLGAQAGAARSGSPAPLSAASRYGIALLLVAAASVLAFVVENVIAAPNLTLIYVLPVIITGTAFGWGPSLVAALAGVLAFDFFFTEPYFSFRIYSPSDIWAAALLLAIAAIATTVAAQSRKRALEAGRAQEQAEALRSLAHVVIEERSRGEILEAAATALHRIFRAPAVIFLEEDGTLRRAATAGQPQISPIDEEAARGALKTQLHTRAETYPYDAAEFEFWPVHASCGCRCAIGVDFTHAEEERPDTPERFTDVVAAYLAVALTGAPA
jgi:two-component system sensor histidine kinase KdpD